LTIPLTTLTLIILFFRTKRPETRTNSKQTIFLSTKAKSYRTKLIQEQFKKYLPPTNSTFIKVIILLELKTKTIVRRKKEK